MADLRVGDPHNLMSRRTTGDDHPQYVLKKAGRNGPVPLLYGPVTFNKRVIFEKGFRFHTDNVAADDPLGDSFFHSNQAGGPRINDTWDASSGVTFNGFTGVGSILTLSELNFYGSLAMDVRQLEAGDFSGGAYLALNSSDLVLLVNTNNVQITLGFTRPQQTILTVKDITGAVNPNIVLKAEGKIDGPGGQGVPPSAPDDEYHITNPYEHVVAFKLGLNTVIV